MMRTALNKKGKYRDVLERAREDVYLRGSDALSHHDFSRWGFWVGSAIIASPIAFLCYAIGKHVEHYSQFTVGSITWRAASKSQDYYLLLGAIFGFLGALLIFLLLTGRIRKRIAPAAVNDFHTLIVFASLPAILWYGRLFLSRDPSSSIAALSVLLVLLVLLFAFLATLKDIKPENSNHFSDVVSSSALILLWSALSGMALLLAVSRLAIALNLGSHGRDPISIRISLLASVAFGVALLITAWSRLAMTDHALRSRLRAYLILAQCLAPWFFLIIISPPWIEGGRLFFGYPMRPTAWVAIGFLVVIAYADLARRWKFKPSSHESFVTSGLSPMCLVGLLLFLKVDVVGGLSLNPDDYHVGEFIVPWWSWSVHHMIPFWDYAPARGLVNYVPGFLSSVLFDGKPASYWPTVPFTAAAYLLLCYAVVARSIGVFPAFLAFLLMPLANGMSEIDVFMTAALCVLCELYLSWSPSVWLTAWLGIGALAVLTAPGQGGLLVIATVPLGLSAARKALRHEQTRLLKCAGTLVLTLAALSVFTSLGKMLVGAIRYGIEQSSINSIANGIEWAQSWKPGGTVINQLLWESARVSWILVAVVAGVLIIKTTVDQKSDRRKRVFVFAIPIFILMLLFVFRAAGRIDPGDMSRLGVASLWALALLLPLLLIAAYGKEHRALVVATFCFLAAIINHDFTPFGLKGLLYRSAEVAAAPVNVVNGNDFDLPNLGRTTIDESGLRRLQSIKHVLSLVVDPGETYLDLTNRSAEYFYLGFRPPIETGAVYNLVSEGQQFRAIESIEKTPPPIVLASAENNLQDGGTSAYRSYLLYRYLVERYVPVSIDGKIYLVRPDRLSRVAGYVDVQAAVNDENRLPLLDAVFRMESIEELPVAWGRSLKTLAPQLKQVQALGPDMPPQPNSLRDVGSGHYLIDGPNPSLTFDISRWNLAGREAGILTFDFSCRGCGGKSPMRIFWGGRSTALIETTAIRFVVMENGPVAVPLDAAPRWLLAKYITSLKFDVADLPPGSEFSITNLTLWQRTSVDKFTN